MRYFNDANEFLHGRRDFARSSGCASACRHFTRDNDEEEEVSDSAVSCYNCLYRRWTAESFICVKFAATEAVKAET